MGKTEFSASNQLVADYLYADFIEKASMESSNLDKVMKGLPAVLDNNLGCKLSYQQYGGYCGCVEYRIACKLMLKYNDKLKDYKRKPDSYEFGDENTVYAKHSKELVDLTTHLLEYGIYFAQINRNNYAVLNIRKDTEEGYMVKTDLYFVGTKWRKYKKKFDAEVAYYKEFVKTDTSDMIAYSDGRPSVEVIFKPFDQVVMKDKDKLISYIDTWVENIPVYYDTYNMTPKLSILLHGEPGTGKSTVAKAVAKHLGIGTVRSISPDYFQSGDDDRGSRGRGYRQNTFYGDMIFSIDDIDCICKSREDSDSAENNQILSSLLSFLDNPPTFNFKAKNGVRYPVSIVIATTNYYDKLDPAVKRYGRFDLKIEMKEFDKSQAEEMCAIYDLRLEDVVPDSNKKGFKISPSYLQSLCTSKIDNSLKESTNTFAN